MNYLAHLFLAEENDDAKLGALLGDFVKGTILDKYSKEVEKEIQIHRKIDFYTDHHPIVKDAKKLFSVEKRKYGNILLVQAGRSNKTLTTELPFKRFG